MAFGIDDALALASLAGSFFGMNEQQRAAERARKYLEALNAPTLAARNYLLTQMGKESQVLAAQYRTRRQDIQEGAATQASVARARGTRTGNLAGARGEAMRIEDSKRRALNQRGGTGRAQDEGGLDACGGSYLPGDWHLHG
jgi:hypothetical protein